ncbi:hypothetical protein GYMLUDRAFT_464914 [Collybiopsis luxurians FD-317 M1]|uniref:Unplaced genomic scaffold GYMLUscaffold_16, whole genome shotgun sequence n=1 Tax=Collybiopsis luxurians FD-317 M1 TaxID=944289 RepID=A0A0D0CKA5_9AGAR|nr:hypothetical protein GYMLUDRAFT_464914 [Collybiopsis luxurians FD-317 M1]
MSFVVGREVLFLFYSLLMYISLFDRALVARACLMPFFFGCICFAFTGYGRCISFCHVPLMFSLCGTMLYCISICINICIHLRLSFLYTSFLFYVLISHVSSIPSIKTTRCNELCFNTCVYLCIV